MCSNLKEVWVVCATLDGVSTTYLFKSRWNAVEFFDGFGMGINVSLYPQQLND